MAYTTLQTTNWGTGPTIGVSFYYDKQRSGANMQYKIKVQVDAVTGSSYFGYPIYLSIVLNGETRVSGYTLKGIDPNRWTTAIVYETGWLTVINKSSGVVPVSINLYSGSGSNRNITYSYSLPVLPALSLLLTSDGTLGTAQTLTVSRPDSTLTHTITYYCGTTNQLTGVIASKSSSTSISWTPPLNLATKNTNGDSVTVTFMTDTYSGSTKIGSTAKSVTMTIPPTVKPSVSMTFSDSEGLLATYGKYIASRSVLAWTVVVDSSAMQGATISSTTVKIGSLAYTSSSGSVKVPSVTGTTSGTLSVDVTVKDSRSRTATNHYDLPVYNYTAPKISSCTFYRCTEDGTQDDLGEYIKSTMTASITSLDAKNTAAYAIEYKANGSGTWTSQAFTGATGYAPTAVSVVIPAASTSAWDVRVKAEDAFVANYSGSSIGKGFVLLQGDTTGTGLSVGGVATEADTFEVNIKQVNRADVQFDGAATVNNVKLKGTLTGDNINGKISLALGNLSLGALPLKEFVYDQGTNGSWKYRKWYPSGRVEAWYTVNTGQIILGTKYADGVYSNDTYKEVTVTIPGGIFTAKPRAFINVRSNSYTISQVYATNAGSVLYRIWSSFSSTPTCDVDIYLVQN